MDFHRMPLRELQNYFETEKQINVNLEELVSELKTSVAELDKRMDDFEDESNEWKTRFETQSELNQQLQHQSARLNMQIDKVKQTIKEVKHSRTYKPSNEVSSESLENLSNYKMMVGDQLKNLELRLEEEMKAFYKSNEEKKNLVLELNHLKNLSEGYQTMPSMIGSTSSNKKNLIRKLNSLPPA